MAVSSVLGSSAEATLRARSAAIAVSPTGGPPGGGRWSHLSTRAGTHRVSVGAPGPTDSVGDV
ncbi:MAG: hypothetical protein AAF808_04895 [Cyanobacteria bacterium P01_D01_bin.2]